MADLLVERPRDGVALVRLNRPEARNALNGRVRTLLADAFTKWAGTTACARSC